MSGLRVWLPSVSSVASEMYPVLFEPSLLVKTPRHRRLTTLHVFFFPEARMQQELCVCMPIPRIALRESSGAPRRLGNNWSSERVLTVTEMLHGFLGSLYSQSYDFILAAIEWAQRDFRFWFRVSMTQLQYIIPTQPCFFFPTPFFLWQSKDQQHYSPCTWFLHTQGEKPIFWIWCLLNQVP